MATLLLRLQAPMQSWGVSSHFTSRDTTREPSKSGVIGLLCAALGRPRDADLSDLAALKMGVRVDREGVFQKDFHIAQDILPADGGKLKSSEMSDRYYLADAAFLVGLEGPIELLQEIHAALKNPYWLLYLGRKAFIPGKPVWLQDGIKSKPLRDALAEYPALTPNPEPMLRLVLESDSGEFVRSDVPISFAERKFSSRRVHMGRVASTAHQEV